MELPTIRLNLPGVVKQLADELAEAAILRQQVTDLRVTNKALEALLDAKGASVAVAHVNNGDVVVRLLEKSDEPPPGTGAWAWQQMQRGPEVWVRRTSEPVSACYHMIRPGLIENKIGTQINGTDSRVLDMLWPTATDWELCDAPKQADRSGPTEEQIERWRDDNNLGFTAALRLCWTAAREGMVPVADIGTRERALINRADKAESEARQLSREAASLREAEAHERARANDAEARVREIEAKFRVAVNDCEFAVKERDQLRADLAAARDTVAVTHGQLQQSRATVTQLQSDLAALRGEEFTETQCESLWERAANASAEAQRRWRDFSDTHHDQLIRFANACRVRPERGRKLTEEQRVKLLSLVARFATVTDSGSKEADDEYACIHAERSIVAFVESLLAPAAELTPPLSGLPTEEDAAALRTAYWGSATEWEKTPHDLKEKWRAATTEAFCLARRGYVRATEQLPGNSGELTKEESGQLMTLVEFYAAERSNDKGTFQDEAMSWRKLRNHVASLRSAAVSAVRGELERVKAELDKLTTDRNEFRSQVLELHATLDRILPPPPKNEPTITVVDWVTRCVDAWQQELTTLRARVVLPMSEAQKTELAQVARSAYMTHSAYRSAEESFLAIVDALAPRIARVGVKLERSPRLEQVIRDVAGEHIHPHLFAFALLERLEIL